MGKNWAGPLPNEKVIEEIVKKLKQRNVSTTFLRGSIFSSSSTGSVYVVNKKALSPEIFLKALTSFHVI